MPTQNKIIPPVPIMNNRPSMNSYAGPLSLLRMGWALGATGVFFYLGCMLTMATVPHDRAVVFFNSLLHGIDVEPILRERIPATEVLLGLISTLVLGWLAGALLAGFYNIGRRSS